QRSGAVRPCRLRRHVPSTPPDAGRCEMSWHLLIIANETLASRDVRDLVAARSAGRAAQVLVIAPALSGRLAYWASDDREARRAAETRLRTCLATLNAAGVAADA